MWFRETEKRSERNRIIIKKWDEKLQSLYQRSINGLWISKATTHEYCNQSLKLGKWAQLIGRGPNWKSRKFYQFNCGFEFYTHSLESDEKPIFTCVLICAARKWFADGTYGVFLYKTCVCICVSSFSRAEHDFSTNHIISLSLNDFPLCQPILWGAYFFFSQCIWQLIYYDFVLFIFIDFL